MIDRSHPQVRYLDGRGKVSRRLRAVISSLTAELGGEEALNAGQRLLLGQLREKIAAVYAITTHIDRQASLLGEDGELIPALRRSHLAYSNSIRRDVEVLFGLKDLGPGKKTPDLAAYLAGKRKGGGE